MATDVQWSELQRDPTRVAALADDHDVRVRRRDGAPLILSREDRTEAVTAGAQTAARALRSLMARTGAAEAGKGLEEEFPWLDQLSADDLAEFVRDFTRAVQASAELRDWSVMDQVLSEWKDTAVALADPELRRILTEPVTSDFGLVASPADC